MPMAAMLAHAKILIGSEDPAKVVVVQRNSLTSGWKVDSINAGKSVIGGIEPELDVIVAESVSDGILSASHDYNHVADADVILICVQTDKKGFGPDYGPLMESLENIATVLQKKKYQKKPLIIFESTLAPSSMMTVVKEFFEKYTLIDGQDILLGNSPNRVMPGRLVERIRTSDKVVGGLSEEAVLKIERLYKNIVTQGVLHTTNSFSAEIIKTLENAYRDVRIAFSAEIVRFCDECNIDFYSVRDKVNERIGQTDGASAQSDAVPTGGLLIPTIGVGGHCLPKDGILLLWRKIEKGTDMSNSLFIKSREINNESPAATIRLAESTFGKLDNKKITLLGTAYRFNSEDTRNSPSLALAQLLLDKGCTVTLHDPFVKPGDQNLRRFGLDRFFTNNLTDAVTDAECIIFCTAHTEYHRGIDQLLAAALKARGIIDGCNLFSESPTGDAAVGYAGIGKGTGVPSEKFIDFVFESFQVLDRGVANEVKAFVDFANVNYIGKLNGQTATAGKSAEFNTIHFETIRKIAATCVTGCAVSTAGVIDAVPEYDGFSSRLVQCSFNAGGK
jgi:UDP-N-acetyl-D-mannosaminuronic acid dehydrogenase